MSLLDKRFVVSHLTHKDPWCWSHGSAENSEDLGAGILYYALAYSLKARTCVCLGSGGGFVPRLMRQAQRDLGLTDARTVLVDGAGEVEAEERRIWGKPCWTEEDSTLRQKYPEVEIVRSLTRTAFESVFRPAGTAIDFLHIDADHHYEGVRQDFELYSTLVANGGVITLHDTHNFRPPCGVPRLVEELRAEGRWGVVDLAISFGTALVQRLPERA